MNRTKFLIPPIYILFSSALLSAPVLAQTVNEQMVPGSPTVDTVVEPAAKPKYDKAASIGIIEVSPSVKSELQAPQTSMSTEVIQRKQTTPGILERLFSDFGGNSAPTSNLLPTSQFESDSLGGFNFLRTDL